MAFNLIDTVKGYLTPDLISKASSYLGESESGVSKALSGIVPAALSGFISKATSGGSGASEVLSAAKDSHSSGMLDMLGNFAGDGGGFMNKGLSMLQGLFGDKVSSIISAISSFAGIKSSSASSLFSMAAPVASASIGKYASENNLSADGLSSFLSSQKSAVMNMLPSGLSSLAGSLGLSKISDTVSSGYQKATGYVDEVAGKKGGGMGWLLWLLLLALAALAAWYFLFGGKQGCNGSTTTSDTTVNAIVPDTGNMNTNTTTVNTSTDRVSMKVKLPDGKELDAYKGGIEDQLVTFLNADWQKLGADSLKNRWFDFDNLNFKTGSAEITPESQQQVDNLTAILKAFPAAKIKIGGYTDKTGNEDANVKLSGQRATAVKVALDKAGVGGQVAGAEGYGSKFAKYASDAPEADRVKDRHVSISVRM